MLLLAEAKSYIGKTCAIAWQDRTGKEFNTVSKIYDATFVPLYGGYLITDVDDIRLDRISEIALMEEAAVPATKIHAAMAPEQVAA